MWLVRSGHVLCDQTTGAAGANTKRTNAHRGDQHGALSARHRPRWSSPPGPLPRLVLVAVAVRPARRCWTAIANPSSPERRCHMARLRLMLLTLAVAVLLLVGTASAALAGITATGID
jgi:hypothetical protein